MPGGLGAGADDQGDAAKHAIPILLSGRAEGFQQSSDCPDCNGNRRGHVLQCPDDLVGASPMQIYLFTAGVVSDELITLEARLRSKLPGLQVLIKLDELIRRAAESTAAPSDKVFVIFPILAEAASLDGLIAAAEQEQPGHLFYICQQRDFGERLQAPCARTRRRLGVAAGCPGGN